MPNQSLGDKIEEYVLMRDMLAEKRKEFKEFESKVKSDMELLEVDILEMQRSLGVTSISTGDYTAFQTTKEFYRVGDWDKIVDYVKDTGNFQIFEKRIGKLAQRRLSIMKVSSR